MRKITYALVLSCTATVAAQQSAKPPSPIHPDTPRAAAITKLSATTYRIGEITLDTAARTLSVPGTINDAATLEFVATTENGLKSYESAISLRCNAVTFNAAMLLLGVDPARSKPSKTQFDTEAPQGDAVDVTVSWTVDGKSRTEPIELLLFDQRSKKTLPAGPWVYTGSQFYDTGEHRFYLAEQDGVLIGFMHGPQSIIDNPRSDALGGFGNYILNPNLGLKPESTVSVTVRVIGKGR
jgi:hypothetical protein